MTHPLSFKKHLLENELTVYWQRRRNIAWDGLRVSAWAGFRYDRPEAVHCFHLLEHQMFYGGVQGYEAPFHDDAALTHWTLSRGFKVLNAYTDPDRIYFDGETTRHEHFPKLVNFLAAMTLHPVLSQGLSKQRDIVRGERSQGKDKDQRDLERTVLRLCYGDHPSVMNEIIPEDDVLDSLTIGHLREHHYRLFQPGNMFAVVVSPAPLRRVSRPPGKGLPAHASV